MLSRVAENIYWMGRYLERAEDAARLVSVNTNLLLDLPKGIAPGWEPLIVISGAVQEFREQHAECTERRALRFLIGDEKNSSSILSSLRGARENCRTIRDIVPRESWEDINDVYFYARENLQAGLTKGGRHKYLRQIVRGCQTIVGSLAGTMNHDEGFAFLRLGRFAERADMTTRIVDVGTGNFLAIHAHTRTREELDTPEPFDNILWMSVLRSLSAFQMYRQHVRERVNGADVVGFLLQNALHPRSVVRCLTEMQKTLEGVPNADRVQRAVGAAQKLAWSADIEALLGEPLHTFIDQLQLAFAAIHEAIAVSWFLPRTTTTQ
jgi:uncharacterized alpha-E superfamily protein